MPDTCLVGPSATFDAIAYARAKIEDTDLLNPVIPDSSFLLFVQAAAQEFSRHAPWEDVIGNVAASPPTSPMMTVANQMAYVCSTANGFPVAPIQITDVLYRASATYSAANELAYLSILPFSPVNRFLYSPNLLDSPSERILRNEYLNELQHYGKGYAGIYRDRLTGRLAFDLYPVPVAMPSIPIFVRYLGAHANASTEANNPVYPTVPDDLSRYFGDLVYAEALDVEADRLAKFQRARAGLLDLQGDAVAMRELAAEVRFRATGALGAHTGIGQVSN
jgi:hypothetical protein